MGGALLAAHIGGALLPNPPLGPHQSQDMHLLLAFATFIGAATAMPMVYYPAQYIPADEVLVRMPRQLPQGLQGPLRPVRQSDFAAADQEASADTAYGAAPVGRVKIQVYRGPSKGTGYDAFAPWGYYNTQPVDLGPHH